MADSDINDGEAKKKFRYRKPDTRNRSEELMIKYYKDPENQKNLRERISRYKEGIADIQRKITHLEKFIFEISSE
jgi:hypothetical protein